jgi:hypothetical protein
MEVASLIRKLLLVNACLFFVSEGRSIGLRCDIVIARSTPRLSTPRLRGLRDLVFFLQGPRSLASFLQ